MTIGDIAAEAGLSKGAVSYALNNKPGVSNETRGRVHAIAERLGWTPSLAARSLSTSRADAVGLVLSRPARMLGIEPFYMEFIAGIEDTIAARSIALMLHIVDDAEHEISTYEKWWAERRVDGVLLVDLSQEDPRVEAVRRVGIPAVSVSSPESAACRTSGLTTFRPCETRCATWCASGTLGLRVWAAYRRFPTPSRAIRRSLR